MRQTRGAAIIVLLIVVFALLNISRAYAQDSKPIKIGILHSLTRTFSAMGIDSQNGATIWLNLINGKGGIKGHPVQAVQLDDQSDATKGTLAVKRLIDMEKMHVVAGTNGTGVALAVGAVCEEREVPFVALTASEVFEKTLKPRWSFRPNQMGWELVDWGLAISQKLNPKNQKIAILYQGAAFGKSLYDDATYYAPRRGLKIVAAEKYDPAGTEFGAQISTILASNPDVVIVYCADMAGPLAMKQMRAMGMNKPIITNDAINMKAVRDSFKDTFSIPPYVYSSGSKPDVWWQLPESSFDYKFIAPFARVYEDKSKDQWGFFQHVSINALSLIKESFERALDKDPKLLDRDPQVIRKALRDALETAKNVNFGLGVITMTPDDHCGQLPGSSFATFHWQDRKLVYDPGLSDLKVLPAPRPK